MTIETWLAFALASLALQLIPGPTILSVISYSAVSGYRAILPLVAGVMLGDATALLVSLAGIGVLLSASELLFSVLKWIGGFYLIYLGIRLLINHGRGPSDTGNAAPTSGRKMLASIFVITALNPKGIMFFLAFLPQFVTPAHAVMPQLWILGATFVVLAGCTAFVYAGFSSSAARLLESKTAQGFFGLSGGLLLTAAGVWVLFTRRPAI